MSETHKKLKYIYVGIDCHKMTHTASVINAFNEPLGTITFNTNKEGFKALVDFVSKYLEDGITAVYGLEDCNHLGYSLASYLMAKKYIVKVVNPIYTYNERKSNPIVSKTDKIDSLCIAKVTLDKLDTLPNVRHDNLYWTLKQLSKMREAILKHNVEYKFKLHAQLLHHYPNYYKFFHNFDCNTALAIWETYPNPMILMNTPIEEVETLVYSVSKGYFNSGKVETILHYIKEYDYAKIDYQAERDALIKTLVKHIRYNNEQLEFMDHEIDKVVEKTGYKLTSMVGIDKVLAAKIISEIGNIDRFSSADKLARYAGIAPVSFSSGKKDKDVNNKYGNRKLNSYIYILACIHINPGGRGMRRIMSPIFYDYYQKKISEGKTKHQAILQVMRRLTNIIYGLMKNRSEYVHSEELAETLEKKHNEQVMKDRAEKKAKELKELKKSKRGCISANSMIKFC
jgi:transposase